MLPPDLQRIAHIREYCANIQDDLIRFGSTFELFQADLAFQRSVSFAFCRLESCATVCRKNIAIQQAGRSSGMPLED